MFRELIICVFAFCLCEAIDRGVSPKIALASRVGGHVCGDNEMWYDKCFCVEDCNCGLKCYEGNICFCKPGYKRLGDCCVTQCPPDTICPRTMILADCPSCAERCYPTDITVQPRCDIKPLLNRTLTCVEHRKYCVCPPGWKWFNGECVETCPPYDCGDQGFVYNPCYNHDWQKCPYYLNGNESVVGSGNCYPGCFCPIGFYFMNGNCLRESWCPIGDHKCQPGYEYVTDGNLCQRWCTARFCLECPVLTFFKGCICVRGTYWNPATNKCVDEKHCTPEEDGYCPYENTEYTQKNPKLNLCPGAGLDLTVTGEEEIGCFCIDGYLYDQAKGKCVPKNECGKRR